MILILGILSLFNYLYASNEEIAKNYSASVSTSGRVILGKQISRNTSFITMFDIYHRDNKGDDTRKVNADKIKISNEYSFSRLEA